MEGAKTHIWMRYVLLGAAAYNIACGCCAVLYAPEAAWINPEMWRALGWLLGTYGVGFAIAAFDPIRHWPIVLIGLLSKLLGPLGFLSGALHGRSVGSFGWTVLLTDVVWWAPFALILAAAHQAALSVRRNTSPEIQKLALRARTQYGDTLLELSQHTPLLLVFLRHAGCSFCREALADIARQRAALDATGTRVVLIHMSDDAFAARFFAKYGLNDLFRVSDSGRHLYRAFGLGRSSFLSVAGPKVWWRAIQAGVFGRHGVGWPNADPFQMPGLFLIFHGEIVRSYQHHTAADRPRYVQFASGPERLTV